jgi:flotillin
MSSLLLSAAESYPGWLLPVVISAGIAGALFIGMVALLIKQYKRCPPNKILVVCGKAGRGESSLCVHGGARFIVPLFQECDWLSLEPMQIEIPLRGALSSENIRVNVPSVFTVAVGVTPEQMQNAAIRLLGLTEGEIKKQAEDIIFGQLRQVIASMPIEDINRDREKFLENVQSSLEPELKKIGLVLINVNITDITDESGYIEAIGRKAASEAIQQAEIDVAVQVKKGAIGVAEAEREKEIQVANARKVQTIGTREAERDRAIRVAEMDKEQVVGEQTANFEREAQVAHADREKRIRIADADARAIEGENEAAAAVAASRAQLKVAEAQAYQKGETEARIARAAVLESESLAMAKAALAEATEVEAKRRAELEAPAKAEKAKIVVDAEAEADKRRIHAEGEASAIFAKLEAEARGQYEILAKKGEGLRAIIDACGGAQEAFQMMMLEHFDDLVNASAQAISNIKFDKIVVWEGGGNGADGTTSTARWLHEMSRTLPPMLQVMQDIGGIEIPETLAKLASAEKKEAGKKESAQPTAAAGPPPQPRS